MRENNLEKHSDFRAILERLTHIENLLESKTEKPLSFEEACEYLDVSASFLYKLTANNSITYSKPNGKKLYFRKSDLNAWILKNPVKSKSEIEDAAIDYMLKNPKKA